MSACAMGAMVFEQYVIYGALQRATHPIRISRRKRDVGPGLEADLIECGSQRPRQNSPLRCNLWMEPGSD